MEFLPFLRYGAMAGLSAGMFMTLVMIVLQFLLNTVSLPEVLAEGFVDVAPAQLFSAVLGILEAYAKSILFVTFFFVQVALGGAFGNQAVSACGACHRRRGTRADYRSKGHFPGRRNGPP
jgi:cytochrome c553